MMTRSRTLFAALATATLATVPAASHASAYQAALDSCVKAFMTANFDEKEAARVVELDPVASGLTPFVRAHTFVLTAKGMVTGKRYVTSICKTDKAGGVSIEPM